MNRILLFAFAAALAGPALGQSSERAIFSGLGSNQPIEVEADSLEVVEEDNQRVSVFSGNVTANRGPTVIRGAKITIYSDPEEKEGAEAEIRRIEVTGRVYVNEGDQTATGNAASFDMTSEVATLSGDVVLTQGQNVISGDRLVVDMKSGRAKVDNSGGGRIRGVFTPGSRAGQ